MESRFETFTGILTSINRSIQKIKNIEMSDFGLKGIYVQCLFYLNNYKDGMSFKDLCLESGEDKSVVSKIINYLTEQGLVKVVGEQKYKNMILLTDKGKVIGEKINIKVQEYLSEASVGISESDRNVMYATLDKINQNLINSIKSKGENYD